MTSCRWPHSLGSDLLPALRPRAGVTAETPCLHRLGKAMVFLVVLYGCESQTVKKAVH